MLNKVRHFRHYIDARIAPITKINNPRRDLFKRNYQSNLDVTISQNNSITIEHQILQNERMIYKQAVSDRLTETLLSNEVIDTMKHLSLSEYKFVIAKPYHINQVLDLLSNQYTKNNPLSVVFGITPHSHRMIMGRSLESKINAGRCLIVINKNNKIIGTVCGNDYYDAPLLQQLFYDKRNNDPSDQYCTTDVSLNFKHVTEMLKNEETEYKLEKFSENKYGKLWHSGHLVVDKSISNISRYLGPFLLYLTSEINWSLGYEYVYGEATHPFVCKICQDVGMKVLHEIDFSDYLFNDGIHSSYYYHQLAVKKQLSDQKLMELKQASKLKVVVGDRDENLYGFRRILLGIIKNINNPNVE